MAKKPVHAISLRALGDACIITPLGNIDPSAEILFAAALYLIIERRQPVSRRSIQAILWPAAADRVASHRMRQTLLKLKQLGFPIALGDKGSVALGAELVSVDFEEFLAARKGVERTGTDALVMLPAYEPRFSEAFLEWLDARKAEVNGAMTRVMLGIIARHRVKGEWVEAELNASRLLRFQPYNEEATLAMAEACAMRGGKLDAMRILDRYLSEVGSGPTDLRLPATVMRKRIADRMHPRADAAVGESPLVGRGEIMERLGDLLGLSRTGRGQSCLVWGDAGVGKSRLLAEFATFASLNGIPTQRVQCRPSDAHRPLSVFVDLVPGLRAMRGAIGCEPETFGYLDRLTKHKPTKIEIRADEGDAEFVYAKVQQSLFDLVDAVSDEGCLIILIEDIHWLDATSAKVLHLMVSWAADHSIFFAFTAREQPESWQARRPDRLADIHLPPLEAGPSRDVVLGVVRQHGREIDEKNLDWCVKVAEGNPYFLQELANQWVEIGQRHKAPSSLTAVLNERIARIHEDALQVLQTCAVLENNSTLERMEAMLGYKPHRMLRAINELANAGMLVAETGEGDKNPVTRFFVRHDLLSNAVLARLAPPALAFLHRRAGVILEMEIGQPQSAAILWDCAKHWQLAGDIGRAFELARSCATHLMEVGLPSEAADAYERSLPYCSGGAQRLEMLEGLAHAAYRSGAWEKVNRTVVQVRNVQAIVRPNDSLHDELELMDLNADRRKKRSDLTLVRALGCLHADCASANHRAQAGGTALMLADLACDHTAMREIYGVVSALCENEGVAVASKLRAEMVFHTACGDLAAGVSSARQLVQEHKDNGHIGDVFNSLCNASVSCRVAGLFDDSEAYLLEALGIADEHRLVDARQQALADLANLSLELGRTDDGRQWFQMLEAIPTQPDDFNTGLNVSGIATRLALLDMDFPRAKQLTALAMTSVYPDQMAHRKSYSLALTVAAHLTTGGNKFERALSALEEIHERSRVNAKQAFVTFVLYRGLRRKNMHQKAKRLLNEYLTKYRREPWAPGNHLLDSLPT